MADRTKSGQFTKKNQAEAFQAAQTLSKEAVLESVAKIRSGLDTQVAKIAEAVQEKLTELETVTAAVEFQKAEAERIHGVEAIARNIDEANIAFQEKTADLARQSAEAQRNFAAQLEAARSQNVQAIQNLETERVRNQTAWNYSFEQQKKAANDGLQEELRIARKAEQIRKEDLERGWALREETLKAQETEVTELRTKAAGFPAELEKAINAAEGKGRGMAEREKNHEIAILKSEQAALRTVDKNTIDNLNAKLADKDEVIKQLTIQLAAANEAQKAIATKALDTAGNVKALADLQAATQANNSNGQKRV